MAGLNVVIDVFRAFTTACHVMAREPSAYFMVCDSAVALRIRQAHPRALMIGKAEVGADCDYDLPNSPALARRADIRGRVIIHRTSAGAAGLVAAASGAPALAACFANLGATVDAVRSSGKPCSLMPMGYEGRMPSLEDDLCVEAIRVALAGGEFDLHAHHEVLRQGPGRYFFGEDQSQYPVEDFELCLTVDAFDFPIWARRCRDYVALSMG